jgi:hypothetical protein
MDRPTKLHPVDEKTLTAKAVAFRVLSRHQFNWDKELDALGKLKESIVAAGTLHKAEHANVGVPGFLREHFAYIETSVSPLLAKKSPLLGAYLSDLSEAHKRWISIAAEAEQWLRNIEALGTDYLKRYTMRKVKFPKTRLYQQVSADDCALRGLGGLTLEENAERIIWLFYDAQTFHLASYFSIPYVLSHEFWCHALSRLDSAETTKKRTEEIFGTDPSNTFEEGWMDYVHIEILLREMPRIIGSELDETYFDDHSRTSHESRTNKPGTIAAHHGYLVARRFHSFLEQNRNRLKIQDPWEVFLQLSLDLNLLPGDPDPKSYSVAELGNRLGISALGEKARASVSRKMAQSLLAKHEALAKTLLSILTPAGIPAEKFLKLMQTKPL